MSARTGWRRSRCWRSTPTERRRLRLSRRSLANCSLLAARPIACVPGHLAQESPCHAPRRPDSRKRMPRHRTRSRSTKTSPACRPARGCWSAAPGRSATCTHSRAGRCGPVQPLRHELAQAHGADATCPVSTAIFLRVVAEAAWDERQAGARAAEVAPFRRVIAPDAPLAKKLRRGLQWIAQQRAADRTRPCGRVRRIQVMAARVDQQEWRRKVRRHARGSRAWPSPACRC